MVFVLIGIAQYCVVEGLVTEVTGRGCPTLRVPAILFCALQMVERKNIGFANAGV
jgi:hypothetical protein